MTQYMAIDQHGHAYHGLTYPRRDLLARLDRQHADKMYRDKLDGSTVHIGYVIAGYWLALYKVTPWEKGA